MGGAESEVGDGTTRVIVESAIFDPIAIRRTGQRYALRSEASLRFEKGQELRLARIGADRAARLIAEWAGGSVARGRVDTAPDRAARRPRVAVPARAGQPPARDGVRDRRAAGAPRAASAIDDGAGRAGRPIATIAVAGEPQAADDRGRRRRDPRRDRPDLAARHRDRGRRHRGGRPDRAATTRSRRSCRTPRCRPGAPRRSPLRDLVRETLAGAGLTETVSHALVSPRARRAGSPGRPRSRPSPAGRRRSAARSASRTRSRPITRSSARRSSAASSRSSRRTSAAAATTSRSSRSARATAATATRPASGGGSGSRSPAPFEEPAWNRPGPGRRPRRREGRDRARLPPPRVRRAGCTSRSTDEPLLHPGRAARVTRRRGGRTVLERRRRRAPSGRSPTSVDLRGARADRRRARGRRPRRRAVRPTSGPRAPSRHPAAERDLASSSPRSTPAAVRRGRDPRGRGGPISRRSGLFDIYRGAPLAADEKSLAWRLVFQADGADPHRGRDRGRGRGRSRSRVDRIGGRIRT